MPTSRLQNGTGENPAYDKKALKDREQLYCEPSAVGLLTEHGTYSYTRPYEIKALGFLTKPRAFFTEGFRMCIPTLGKRQDQPCR
jgi:hypothetical protein